mmetsp:Transcript_45344/g.119006  ORF Transcript_45344/g.119006 Transcript_45344/m.119006 type:complete len:305 (+) Transcript_45344:1858-2772(+)
MLVPTHVLVGGDRLRGDGAHASRPFDGVEDERERVVCEWRLHRLSCDPIDLGKHGGRLRLLYVKLKGTQRLWDLVDVDLAVEVGVDDAEDFLGGAVRRHLIRQHLHHVRCAQLDRLIKLELELSRKLRALLLGHIGGQRDVGLRLGPEEALARPVVVPKIDEELVDTHETRTIDVRQIEQCVGILVCQATVHRPHGLAKLIRIELARAIGVSVAESVPHLIDRPTPEEVRHHLHGVLLVAREGRSVHGRPLIPAASMRPNSRRPLERLRCHTDHRWKHVTRLWPRPPLRAVLRSCGQFCRGDLC